MRVITGSCKGINLLSLQGLQTRPTKSYVKEAIFNIIGPNFYANNVLDLFAGSGSLGIEALSRGAKQAFFVDKNRQAIDIIKKNITACRLQDKATILHNEAAVQIDIWSKCNKKPLFDYIFLDPPYVQIELLVNCITELQNYHLLLEQTTIICEHSAKMVLPQVVGSFSIQLTKVYGACALTFYKFNNV